jgi:hypothetical protein
LRDEPSIAVTQNQSLVCPGNPGEVSCTPPLQFASEGGVFTPTVHPRDGVAVQ